jgi:putative lipoprotein
MIRYICLCFLFMPGMNLIAGSDVETIDGSATYRDRIALPPNAVFEAVLEDSSLADAMATRMGEMRIENPRVPVQFAISYDPGLIQKGHSYTVRATIRVDGKLWFTTDTSYRVLKQPGDDKVDLLLRLRRVAQ